MAERTCSHDGCARRHHAKGLCDKHYQSARNKQRYAANPEYFKAKARHRWNEKHDDCLARKRQYRAENVELIRQRDETWRDQNRDARRRTQRDRHWENREQRLAELSRQYRENRAARNAQQKAYRRAHPEVGAEQLRRRRARKKSTVIGRITPDLLAAKFAYWGNRCWMCGVEACELDHVKPLAKGGAHALANIRPACRPCNAAKNDRWPIPVRSRRAFPRGVA